MYEQNSCKRSGKFFFFQVQRMSGTELGRSRFKASGSVRVQTIGLEQKQSKFHASADYLREQACSEGKHYRSECEMNK